VPWITVSSGLGVVATNDSSRMPWMIRSKYRTLVVASGSTVVDPRGPIVSPIATAARVPATTASHDGCRAVFRSRPISPKDDPMLRHGRIAGEGRHPT
jgi:hypothetical protein